MNWKSSPSRLDRDPSLGAADPLGLLAENLAWLRQNATPLFDWLGTANEDVHISLDEQGNRRLLVSGELWLESIDQQLAAAVSIQCSEQVDSILAARPVNSCEASISPGKILSRLVDQHKPILLDYLPNLASDLDHPEQPVRLRNLLVLGSLAVQPIVQWLESSEDFPWLSVVLVEDDPLQMAAFLSLVDLPRFVAACKERSVGLSLICEDDYDLLQGRLVDHFAVVNPCALHGLQVIRSPQRSPHLMELHSWLHAPDGLTQHVLGMLGFATDELNQTQQALWSALANRPARQLRADVLSSAEPVVLVASGPSLDSQLGWLAENQDHLTIVAAGSALGSLVRAGIKPVMAVYLERDSVVFLDLCDLAAEGHDLSDIILAGSSTLDPRIPPLFGETIFFHRPSAAASRLFPDEAPATLPQAGPHVVNATLELLLMLGARKLLLVGCDFGTASAGSDRSRGAIGFSNRMMNLPTAGNLGRTVFSEPELMHAHFAFQRMLWFVPGLEVRRLGEGVALPEATNGNADSVLAAWASSHPTDFRQACSKLPEALVQREVYIQLTAMHDVALSSLLDDVVVQLNSSPVWSHSLSLSLGKRFSRFLSQVDDSDRYARAIAAQPLFFLLRPLHDAADGEWQNQVDKAICSIDVLRGVFVAYGQLLSQFLQLRRMPSWDPDWIRGRCLQLDLTPAKP